MRSSTYVFLVLAAVCAFVLRWGVTADVFALSAAYMVAGLFLLSAAISLTNAVEAYRAS